MFGSKVIVPPIWGDISGGGDLRLRIMAISIPRQRGGKFAGSLASLCLLVLDAVVEHLLRWFEFFTSKLPHSTRSPADPLFGKLARALH